VFYFIAGGLCSFAQAQGVLAGEQFAPQYDKTGRRTVERSDRLMNWELWLETYL